MNPERLLQHFDTISEAPDAVARLRRLILDLAVRGKLVEQEAGDEPASKLLVRVRTTKARLTKAGKMRPEKARPVLDTAMLPFPIPATWQWSQLSEIGVLNPRNAAEDTDLASFVPMTLISAEYGMPNGVDEKPWGEIKRGYTQFSEGDVGLAKITPCFENGKSTVFRGLSSGIGAGTTELHIVRPIEVSPDYVLIFLKCPHFIATGIPKMTGTAGQKRVPADYFANSPFPLPPIAEQHRIVAKVDELMALCDQLQAARDAREQQRDQLVAASLHRVTADEVGTNRVSAATVARSPAGPADFHLQHLPRLVMRSEHIKQLRKTVLGLAVRGRLVVQSDDELSTSIAERAANRSDADSQIAMKLPNGWRWAQVADVADARLGKMLDTAKNSGVEYEYLGNTNVHWFDIRTSALKTIRLEIAEVDKYLLENGDVLICEGGHGIGRAAVWRGQREKVACQKALHRVRPKRGLDGDFFSYCIHVYFHEGILRRYFTGVGIPHFTGRALASLVFPLPPIAEQHRIVAKVDELMALCDQLEASLAATQADRARLLDCLLHEALAPALHAAA